MIDTTTTYTGATLSAFVAKNDTDKTQDKKVSKFHLPLSDTPGIEHWTSQSKVMALTS